MAPKGVQRNGKGCSRCRLGRGCSRASNSGWSIAWASTDLRRAHRPAAKRTSSRDAARVRAGVDNDLTFMCAGKYTFVSASSASTYILCAFQDHLHPRAAAVAHVHVAHTHTHRDKHPNTLAPGEAQRFTPSAHSRRYPLHLERGLPLHAWLSLSPLFLSLVSVSFCFYILWTTKCAISTLRPTFYEFSIGPNVPGICHKRWPILSCSRIPVHFRNSTVCHMESLWSHNYCGRSVLRCVPSLWTHSLCNHLTHF